METPPCSWAPTDEIPLGIPTPAAPVISATTGMGVWGVGFTLSSNPDLETSCSGCSSPSIQTVIALNLSFLDPTGSTLSAVDLDTLLAGLLDNGTGGVNGTFRDETGNLSSLGLAAPVMSALANGVWDSGGVFGAPVSYAQPQPPSPPGCSGFLGCVWNTVSGIVVGIAGAIYGAVWTAVEAATQFLKQLGAGLSHLAEVAESAAVGAALEAALQALLAFVEKEITALIDAVVSPIRTAVSNYLSSVNQDFGSMYTAVGNGQPVTTSLGKPFWQDLALPLLMMTAVAVVVETALVVANGLSLGAGFLVGIIVTVIVGTVLTLLAPSSTLISEMLSGGAAAILAMMQFLNDTASSLHKGPLVAHPQSGGLCGYYQSFHTLADAFAVLDDILGSASGIVLSLLLFSIDTIVGVKALTLLASSAILSLTILAFFFDAASLLNSGEEALTFADIGFISGLVALVIGQVAPAIKEIPVFGEFDSVIEYMDYAATGMGGGEVIADTLNYCPGT